MIYIVVGALELLVLLAWLAIYVSTTTQPESEHRKPKDEPVTVAVYVKKESKVHTPARHKAGSRHRKQLNYV